MRDLIRRHFGKQDKQTVINIMVHTMRYMFRLTSAHDMTRGIRHDLENKSIRIIDYRKEIQNGYTVKNVKFWIWYIIANNLSKKDAMKAMKDFKVHDKDRMLAVVAKKNIDKELSKLAKRYKAHTLDEFKEITSHVITETKKYTRNFAYRKLRFIISEGTYSMEDIIMELNYWGLYTIILQYPQIDSIEHCLNLCRRGIHNHGINMIKKATTLKNSVLVRDEKDGTFSSNRTPIDTLENWVEPPCYENEDNKNLVKRMLKEHSGKQNKFLKLITGTFSERFSDFLAKEGYVENNDELFDRLASNDNMDLYIELCAKFLQITPYQAKQFIQKIRKQYSHAR